MYVDSSSRTEKGRTYTRHLIRQSYRLNGNPRHRTIANISKCSDQEIEAIRLALRHKGELAELIASKKPGSGSLPRSLSSCQGLSVGSVWLLYDMARQLGIERALGPTRQAKLALWQVIARVIGQGSRLSAVRLATSHAACDVLDLEAFDEDDLYENLDWLCHQQAVIEKRLFDGLGAIRSGLFLYDVTSSYLEGSENELAAFGYNRDGKRGKKQIVIGLLCAEDGQAVSIEVFVGNTQDPQTFIPQIRKVLERFGAEGVTFVGDRGMIKAPQIEALGHEDCHYITAITKPQIEKLLKDGVIQMDLFDEELAEVSTNESVRYVIRRNPVRALDLEASRRDKLASLRKTADGRNAYLQEHPRAKVAVALRRVQQRARTLRLSRWVTITGQQADRRITVTVEEAARAEDAKFDGCYVLKTDLACDVATKEIIHDRYKDLTLVETAFRTSKTVELEVRPIHVRLASRTRGHVFVVMLAYRIVRELARRWVDQDMTVQEGINELSTLCATQILDNGRAVCNQIPEPRGSVKRLLASADVILPEALPSKGVIVSTKRKLPSRRKKR